MLQILYSYFQIKIAANAPLAAAGRVLLDFMFSFCYSLCRLVDCLLSDIFRLVVASLLCVVALFFFL